MDPVKARLERRFLRLSDFDYEITSPRSAAYNCFAWAFGDDRRWWEPDPMEQYYWPAGARRDYTLEGLVAAFGSLGFSTVETSDLAEIAIYVARKEPTHASRRVSADRWTSKLGDLEDIAHPLAALEGVPYGAVEVLLGRRGSHS